MLNIYAVKCSVARTCPVKRKHRAMVYSFMSLSTELERLNLVVRYQQM